MTQTQESPDRSGAARFRELAQERYRLEERAENQMTGLLQTLAELRDLDEQQRRWAGHAGVRGATLRAAQGVVPSWIAARLGGAGGFVPLVRVPGFERPLPSLDPLARKPSTEPTKGA